MNKQLSENEALYKLVRLFIVQYLANVHNYKSVQNEAINMMATHVMKRMFQLSQQLRRLQSKQNVFYQCRGGSNQTACMYLWLQSRLIYSIWISSQASSLIKGNKQSQKLRSKSYNFPSIFFEKIISKVFENDIEMINRYEKENDLPTIKFIKNPYLFKFENDNQCLPYKCGIDEAYNKPAEFTYKNTVQKIQRQKKNVQNLVAFTRRQNRKALGLYLDSLKQDQQLKKKTKHNEEEDEIEMKKLTSDTTQTKEFDFIGFL